MMPGETSYLDTPVVPNTAFAEGYNHPDCEYPDATPAVSEVDGDNTGPWVGGAFGSGALSGVKLTLNYPTTGTPTGSGSGYSSAPTVHFTSGNATATATISGSVTAINFNPATGGGSGYTSAPIVQFVGGGGSGATATATTTGYVSSATVTHGGTGYTTRPTVAITGGGGTGAAGTAVISGSVNSVTVSNGGRGYTSTAPPIFFIGGGGSGAAATATMTGSVSSVTITNNGAGSYTSGTPTVTFSAPSGGGVTATGTVNMTGTGATRRVASVTITNPGSGYSGSATIHFSTGNAAGNVNLGFSVASINVTNGGSGYTSAPSVLVGILPPFGGVRATGTAHESASVVGVTITNPGSGYTSAPTISFTGGGGSGATATANLLSKVASVTLNDGGSGYSSAPQVQFVPTDGHGSGAAATSTISGSVVSIALNNPGSGYVSAPGVTFTGGGGSGAAATASLSTGQITISALGDQEVSNNGYSGPTASAEPFNKRTIKRHYGFGGQCMTPDGSATCNTKSSVTIGGKIATIVSWDDGTIKVDVPAGVANCALQQQTQYGGSTAQCGELVIMAGNGKQSIDAVTVTIGGKQPNLLSPGQTIQSAIDAAAPGDMIMVPKGTYKELLIMWKPVRLQGVAAASTVIDGNTHPSGVIDPWRHQISCLFGLALNGQPYTGNGPYGGSNPYDATNQPSNGGLSCPGNGWNYFTAQPGVPQVDRIPFEGILGWDTTVNGNLAEMLQEPTLMGSYEGAGITVLAKGVRVPAGTDWFGVGAEAGYPTGTTLLSSNDCLQNGTNPFPSNFYCNPSRIDGLMVTNSSQGGGGILVHGWGHNLEISNNRVRNNNGTLSGGIEIGQGEFGDGYFQGADATPAPGSCQSSNVNDTQLPYCFNTHTNVHHNMVTLNSSTGDELFTSTPSGGGGVTFCIGSDYYKLNYNWICGNMSSGDGGGVAHLGFSYNGDISKNTIIFNQSVNPTVPTSGGGIVVMGPAPDGVTAGGIECGSVNIDGNLILGNAAESGSGGGIRFQAVNGTEVTRFPLQPNNWYSVNVTNNIIANNVAGWDGGGVGLVDSLAVNFINNTIVSNDTTASAGTLFNAYFAKLASDQSPPAGTCMNGANGACTASQPQPAGLSVSPNSAQLSSALPAIVVCPSGHYNNAILGVNGECRKVSYPQLSNNILWQNRAFHLEVGGTATGGQDYLQSVVTLAPSLNQPSTPATATSVGGVIVTGGTGACVNGASYWDIGVRGDTSPTNHSSGFTLKPQYSVLTNVTGYTGNNNLAPSALGLASQYCNGSRIPPEYASGGYQVPPGTNEGTVPVPVFSLLPGATVDEGNNWVNMKWGPLAMTSPMTPNGTPLANYSPAAGSPAIDVIPSGQSHPATDFFGHVRPSADNPNRFDVGAVEFQAAPPVAPTLTSIAPSTSWRPRLALQVTLTGTNLTGTSAITVSGSGVTVSNINVVNSTTVTAFFTISTSAAFGTRTVTVTTAGGTSNPVNFTIQPVAITSVTPNSGVRGTNVNVTITGTSFVAPLLVTVSGSNVTVSNISVVNDTTITARFNIASGAAIGSRNVTVSSLIGSATLNGAFNVTAPALAALSQNSGLRGTSVPLTLNGTNLGTATGVSVSGSGVSVSNFQVVSPTNLSATFTISPSAGTGPRNVTVVTPSGNATLNSVFTPVAPTLSAITPSSHTRGGSSFNVTLTGTHLTGTTSLVVSGTGVTVSNVQVVNDSTLTATFSVAGSAGATPRTIHTVNSGGATSNNVTFTPLM
jgi:hypothetical protein